MAIKFSEDLVPLTDLKVNPGRVVRHVNDVHRPVLLTSRGRAVAVIQSVADYEKAEEERDFTEYTASRESLYDRLVWQLHVSALDGRDLKMGRAILLDRNRS